MKVILACEESQAVCIEYRKRGHEAYSCDLQPCSGDRRIPKHGQQPQNLYHAITGNELEVKP